MKKIFIFSSFVPTLVFIAILILGFPTTPSAAAPISPALHSLPKNGTWRKPQTLDLLPLSPEEARQVIQADIQDVGPADLKVEVNTTPATLWVGSPYTYRITVTNLGSEPAYTVTLTDTLHATLEFGTPDTSQGTCGAPNPLVCSLGNLSNGAIVTVTLVVTPTLDGPISNTAVVSSTTDDPNLLNNDTTLESTINPLADLSITKTDSADPVLVGASLIYTLTVNNAGPSTATGVTLSDTLPAGLTYVGYTATPGGSCANGAQFTCTLPDLATGATAKVAVRVTTTQDGTLNNTAEVASAVADPNSANNRDSETTTVSPLADLSLVKTDSADPVLVGASLTYTLTVSNAGPDTATGVTLSDTLPAGLTYVGYTATPGGSCSNGAQFTCTLPDLATGATAKVAVQVTASADGTLNNTAEVASAVADPNSANNRESETTTILPVANLSLVKADSADPILVGASLTYTLTINNAGPDTATGVMLTDTLPAGLTYVSYTATPGGTCTNGTRFTCSLPDLVSGATAKITILVGTTQDGAFTNSAVVASAVADTNSGNDSDTENTTVLPVANLSLDKADSADPILVGASLTYTLTVSNAGPDIATGLMLTDTLPAGLSYLSHSAPVGSSCSNGANFTCSLPDLASGASHKVTLRVTATQDGTFTNNAVVASAVADTNASNNSDTENTTVLPVADLYVSKTALLTEDLYAGQSFIYSVTVQNNGPDSAPNVVLTDTLPANLNLIVAYTPKGSCTQTKPVVCALGTVNAGASYNLLITVGTISGGSLFNEVEVTSDIADLNLLNNQDSDTTTVIPVANLAVTKDGQPSEVSASSPVTYTINVVNNGPDTAVGVILTDTLPSGVTYLNKNVSLGSCSGTSQIVCNLGDMAKNATATLTVWVTADVQGTLTNRAVVASSTADTTSTNNTATEYTSVDSAADLALVKTHQPATVYAGTVFSYTLTVSNQGPYTATDVVLTDTLPAQVSLADTVLQSGSCSGTTTVVCELAELVNGDDWVVTLLVTATQGASLTNNAVVSSGTIDPDPDNNTDSHPTTVIPTADLALVKTASPDPGYLGESLTYTLTVTNQGPDDATSLVLTDTLPASVQYQSYSFPGGSCLKNDELVCSLAQLDNGASATLTVYVTPTQVTTIENQAVVASSITDLKTTNNSDSLLTVINPAADLAVTKASNPAVLYLGDSFSYLITVTNQGPSLASGVLLTDTLPANLSLGPIQSSQGICIENLHIDCSLGDIAAGNLVTITIPVTPTVQGPFTNQVTVNATTADLHNEDNSDSALTTVQPLSDLTVTHVGSPASIHAQELLTYAITITNHGPSIATNATLEDVLSPLVNFVSAPAGCTFSTPEVTCDLGDLAVDETRTLTITARTIKTTAGGTITNTLTVDSEPYDPETEDNTSVATTVFLSDTTAPTITWVSPTTSGLIYPVYGEVITLTVIASDDVAIDYVKFYNREVWDQGTLADDVWYDIAVLEVAPFTYQISTLTLGEGWNQMNAEAFDTAGNRAPVSGVYYIWLYYTPPEGLTEIYIPLVFR